MDPLVHTWVCSVSALESGAVGAVRTAGKAKSLLVTEPPTRDGDNRPKEGFRCAAPSFANSAMRPMYLHRGIGELSLR